MRKKEGVDEKHFSIALWCGGIHFCPWPVSSYLQAFLAEPLNSLSLLPKTETIR